MSATDWETTVYVPPGWPREVLPPGVPDWEQTAGAYLLDCCPADYRAYGVLRRHPIVLAEFARQYVAGELRASVDGVATVRANLSDHVPTAVVEQAVEAWQEQTARLQRTRRAVDLVYDALQGTNFVRKL